MKRFALILLILFPIFCSAQVAVPYGGTGKSSFPAGSLIVGDTSLRLNSTTSPTVGYITATSTNATSTLQHTSISGAISILGEYFTNFTTYVRSLFSASSPLTYSAGAIGCTTADTSHAGCLTSTDWNTFNNKQDSIGGTAVLTSRTISTTYPIQGGGDLSSNRTFSIAYGTTTQNNWSQLQNFNGNSTSTAFSVGTTDTFFPGSGNWLFGTTSSVLDNPYHLMRIASKSGAFAPILQLVSKDGSRALTLGGGFNFAGPTIEYHGPDGLSFDYESDYTVIDQTSPEMQITDLGHLLVGSALDQSILYVQPQHNDGLPLLKIASSTGTGLFDIDRLGNVGLSSTTPNERLSVNGNSYVTGTSYLGGAVTAVSTVSVTGQLTFGHASSTQITASERGYFGNISDTGILSVTGLASFGNASTTGPVSFVGNFMVNGQATTTAVNGNFDTQGAITAVGNITTETLEVLHGLASTTATSASNSTSPKSVTASCPAGYNVIGGGGSTTPTIVVGVAGGQPDAGMNGWTETGFEPVAISTNWQVSAYAICAKYNL